VEVPRVEYAKLAADGVAESSATVRARVEAARSRQWARFEGSPLAANAEMGIRELKHHCGLDAAGEALLKAAVQRLGLSARAYHRVLKVARTIADLVGADRIQPAYLVEAKWPTGTASGLSRQPGRARGMVVARRRRGQDVEALGEPLMDREPARIAAVVEKRPQRFTGATPELPLAGHRDELLRPSRRVVSVVQASHPERRSGAWCRLAVKRIRATSG
jgi:hypothetical protein